MFKTDRQDNFVMTWTDSWVCSKSMPRCGIKVVLFIISFLSRVIINSRGHAWDTRRSV